MSFLTKKAAFITKLFSLTLAAAVLIAAVSGCGKKGSDSGNDKITSKANTPETVVAAFSEAYNGGDYKTADGYLLYTYTDVMVDAMGEYESAEEYYIKTQGYSSMEDYYEFSYNWVKGFLVDTYGEDYTIKSTVDSCEKLSNEQLEDIKEYYTKFYEACELNSDDYFSISDLEEAYVVTCKCAMSGELESSSTDEVYIVFKIGNEYKLIQCNGATEDNIQILIDSIPTRTEQLAGLVGQGALKEQSNFNEYFYLFGLQN